MIFKKVFWLAGSLALMPLTGWPMVIGAAVATDKTGMPAVAPAGSTLSPTAQGVVKMVDSSVSEDLVKTYIESSPGQFDLTADNIIELQKEGISGGLLAAMLNHDKAARDREQEALTSAPYSAPPAQVNPETALPGDEAVYSNLAPYGSWDYRDGYGWGWQPYASIDYSSYPWGWLGFGSWSFFPNSGWCWFPRSHFRAFEHFHGRHFDGHFFGRDFNRFAQFNGRGFNQFHGNRSGFILGIPSNRSGISSPFNTVPIIRSPFNQSSFSGFNNRGSAGFRSGAVVGGFHGGGGAHFGGGGGGFHGGGGHGGGGGHR